MAASGGYKDFEKWRRKEMLAGETLLSGAEKTCPNCGVMPQLQVLYSPAGYYIGTYCNCGSYSRESGYYRTREAAEAALKKGPQHYARR
jgi:hypothetical protein